MDTEVIVPPKSTGITLARDSIHEVAEVLKAALSQPVATGLAALAINEMLYKSGLYDPRPFHEERPTSVLGGPVWWTIGTPPDNGDVAQEKRNSFRAMIMTATIAYAISGAVAGAGIGLSKIQGMLTAK